MKDDLVNTFNIKKDKIQIINNPIDTDFIDNKLKETIDIDLPKNKINLLACGRLSYQKGFDNLIKYFSKLNNKEKYHLTILGKGHIKDPNNQEELLYNLVKENNLEDYITFAGFQENSYKWFKKADIFILSSIILFERAIYGVYKIIFNKTYDKK